MTTRKDAFVLHMLSSLDAENGRMAVLFCKQCS